MSTLEHGLGKEEKLKVGEAGKSLGWQETLHLLISQSDGDDEVYDPILIVGSSVGGLLLLVLITATLYKVIVFISHLTPPASNPSLHRKDSIAGRTQTMESGRSGHTFWLCLIV